MQHRSFRIDDILGEDLSKEAAKAKQKEETSQTTAARRPILLPRVQPMIWGQRMGHCCSSSHPNCSSHVSEPSAFCPPWYYDRHLYAYQGKIFNTITAMFLIFSGSSSYLYLNMETRLVKKCQPAPVQLPDGLFIRQS